MQSKPISFVIQKQVRLETIERQIEYVIEKWFEIYSFIFQSSKLRWVSETAGCYNFELNYIRKDRFDHKKSQLVSSWLNSYDPFENLTPVIPISDYRMAFMTPIEQSCNASQNVIGSSFLAIKHEICKTNFLIQLKIKAASLSRDGSNFNHGPVNQPMSACEQLLRSICHPERVFHTIFRNQ